MLPGPLTSGGARRGVTTSVREPLRVDGSQTDAAGDSEPVHEPDGQGPVGNGRDVPPQDVEPAVAVEVADSDDPPVGRHEAESRAADHRPSVHQPDRYVATRVPPDEVLLAIAVD